MHWFLTSKLLLSIPSESEDSNGTGTLFIYLFTYLLKYKSGSKLCYQIVQKSTKWHRSVTKALLSEHLTCMSVLDKLSDKKGWGQDQKTCQASIKHAELDAGFGF